MKSIHLNDEYKIQKKKEKIQKIYEERIRKQKEALDKKKHDLILESQSKIEEKYNKKLKQIESKKKKELENKLRLLEGKKPLKKNMPSKGKISTKMKQKAFAMFQLWCRIARADINGYVTLLDTYEVVKYDDSKKCNAGHYYGKKNFPHMAFIEDNCRPISPRMNQLQGELTGLQWRDGLLSAIGEIGIKRLDMISQDLADKNSVRQFDYYNSKYEQYSTLVDIERHKRGIE